MLRLLTLSSLCLLVNTNLFILSAKVYKGAEYRTNEEVLYGRFDVRYKPANREGVVSSFFTYHEITDSTGWNEIDFEFIGRYLNTFQFNVITPGQQYHIRSQHLLFDPYTEFHDYAFEWTPEYVAWFVDGVEVYRQTGEHISYLRYPQKIMMNIWNPIYTNWVGYFDDSYLPTVSTYDYVQYSSYTPDSGNIGTGNNFTQEWRDDFNEFDENRWSKATHTFAGNQADFDPENVVFRDGYLHLYLTDEINKAGIDVTVPKVIWARANYDSTISIKLSEEITEESATNTGNYILPGGQILAAKLSENNLYVTLKTQNYNPYALNNLIYSGLVDRSSNSNTSQTQVMQINNIDSISFPIKVNVGGGEYSDFLTDQEWNSSVQYGFLMGDANTFPASLDIEGTDDDVIFQSERKGLVTYKFKLPNGSYILTLFFAANTAHNEWEGIFNVYAEDQTIESNFNILSDPGLNKVYLMQKEVQVTDGVLDIYFEEEVDSAFVNAISVDEIITGVNDKRNSKLMDQIQLFQNFPNPFNPFTQIKYKLTETTHVSINVYDILGSKLETLVNNIELPGYHELIFDATQYPSGIYFYRLECSGEIKDSRKMVLLK